MPLSAKHIQDLHRAQKQHISATTEALRAEMADLFARLDERLSNIETLLNPKGKMSDAPTNLPLDNALLVDESGSTSRTGSVGAALKPRIATTGRQGNVETITTAAKAKEPTL